MRIYKYDNLIYPELSYKICGCLFYAHNKLGRFRKEKEYAEALAIIFQENNLKYIRESRLDNNVLDRKFSLYKLDFLVENKVVIELKSRPSIGKDDYYQLKRYLEGKNLKLGLLVNFRDKYLRPKRVINSQISIICN